MAYKHLGQTKILPSDKTSTGIPLIYSRNAYRTSETTLRNALSTRASQSEYNGGSILIGNGINRIHAEVTSEENGYLTFGVEGGPGLFDSYFDTSLYSDVYVKGIGGYNGIDYVSAMTVAQTLDCLDDRIAAMELLKEERFSDITLDVNLHYASKLQAGLLVHYDSDGFFEVSDVDMLNSIGGNQRVVGVTIDESHAIFGDFAYVGNSFLSALDHFKGCLDDFKSYCKDTPIGGWIGRYVDGVHPLLSKRCLYTGETDNFSTYDAFRVNYTQIKSAMDALGASFGDCKVWLCNPEPSVYSFNNQYMVPDTYYGDADSGTASFLPIFRVKLKTK